MMLTTTTTTTTTTTLSHLPFFASNAGVSSAKTAGLASFSQPTPPLSVKNATTATTGAAALAVQNKAVLVRSGIEAYTFNHQLPPHYQTYLGAFTELTQLFRALQKHPNYKIPMVIEAKTAQPIESKEQEAIDSISYQLLLLANVNNPPVLTNQELFYLSLGMKKLNAVIFAKGTNDLFTASLQDVFVGYKASERPEENRNLLPNIADNFRMLHQKQFPQSKYQ
jgi:hypothetical protein